MTDRQGAEPATSGAAAPPVSRWEWRTFGDRFGEAEERLGALAPERADESSEVYLLSAEANTSVKLRDGVVDVKVLEEVDEDGLERWRPILKAGEPLATADVATVAEALGAVTPPQAVSTFAELADGLVRANGALVRAVELQKRRRHFEVGGCMAELTELELGGRTTRTVVVESEHPERVLAAARELGLGGRRNVNLPRQLKALVGLGARRYAVIDVGTNSVKFHIAEQAANGEWTTIVDRAEITRLGEGVDRTGRLDERAAERTIEAIGAMVEEAERNGVIAIAAVGTAGLRAAEDRDEFVQAVRERDGVELEVIPGEEEARLAYAAVVRSLGLQAGSLVVFDTGGGSSQFTFGSEDGIEERFSVNVGAVRFTERFGLDRAVSEEELAAALAAISADLASLDGRPAPDALVGMGGAVTNLTAVQLRLAAYDPELVHGSVLEAVELDRQIELYRTRSADERREIVGLQPKRAEVILAGACIVRTVLAKLGRSSLTVSDRGLRHGVLLERFGEPGA